MGDIADYLIDQGMNAFACYEDCDYDVVVFSSKSVIKCRYCGRGGLYWKNTEHGWRLATSNGSIHSCAKYFASFGLANQQSQKLEAPVSDVEMNGLMPHQPGHGYPVSRDWVDDLECKASSCICNKDGKCVIPSRAKLDSNGKCVGFVTDDKTK